MQQTKTDPNHRIRNISRGLGSLTIQNIVTSILAFVFLAVLLRLTTSNEYTAYSSVLVSIGVGLVVSTFALQFAAARYIAMYSDQDEAKAWAISRSILVLSLIFSTCALIVFEIASPALSLYFMKSTSFVLLFELGGVWLFGYSVSLVLQGIIQGMKRYAQLAKMISVARIATVGFAVVTLELYHNVDYAILSWLIYYVILIVWPLRTVSPLLFRGNQSSENREPGCYSEVLRYSTPLAVAAILGVVSSSGDSIVIGGYTNSLGAYNAAIQISAVLGLVLVTPLITALLPEAASSSGKSREISNVFRLALRFLMLCLLPASLLLAALSKQLLTLFSGGGSYLSASGALEIIAMTYFFYGTQTVIYSALQATGLTFQALVVGAVASVADVVLALLLVPSFGMVGGAESRALESLIAMGISAYFARKYLQRRDAKQFYAKSIVASLIPFGLVFLLSLFVSSNMLTLVPYSILWVIAFLLCVKFMKLLNDEDRVFIGQILPARFHKLLNLL